MRREVFDTAPIQETLDALRADSLTDRFLMRRMGEFERKLLPPLQIGDDELDRSVPTNLCIDPKYDTEYDAYRRLNKLPDTEEVLEEYQRMWPEAPPPTWAGRPIRFVDKES